MAGMLAKYRMTAARAILVCLAGYAVFGLLAQSIRVYSSLPEKDPVTIHEERIRQLNPLLPASGEVGYVTTVENDLIFGFEKSFTNVEYLAQYILTQYTLAPVLVRNSPELPLVVGNFLAGPPAAGFIERHGLVPLRDFGDGLVLYRRDRKP